MPFCPVEAFSPRRLCRRHFSSHHRFHLRQPTASSPFTSLFHPTRRHPLLLHQQHPRYYAIPVAFFSLGMGHEVWKLMFLMKLSFLKNWLKYKNFKKLKTSLYILLKKIKIILIFR
jgi:hypothetical protein